MRCDESRRLWNLYHDSEGDADLHFQIGEHLEMCPDCAQWFTQQSRLEEHLSQQLAAEAPTPELWHEVRLHSGLDRPAAWHRLLVMSGPRLWFLIVGAAVCAAILGLATVWQTGHTSNDAGADLAKLSARWHSRYLAGQEKVEYRSQSDIAVENYLRQRVAFPVRCPPRQDAGFAVLGTGVCDLGRAKAAYLVGHVGQTPVSIFILPRESLAQFPHQLRAVRRENIHTCREGLYEMALGVVEQNLVLVIGQTPPDWLLRVLHAYGSYPEQHSENDSVSRDRERAA